MSSWRVSAIWREEVARYRMIGSQCPECKQVFFPPREVCPGCATAALLALAEEGNQDAPIAVEFPLAISSLAAIE